MGYYLVEGHGNSLSTLFFQALYSYSPYCLPITSIIGTAMLNSVGYRIHTHGPVAVTIKEKKN
jgi:hypothetical protein